MSVSPEALRELAARCEREEPSRELDCAIFAAVRDYTIESPETGFTHALLMPNGDGGVVYGHEVDDFTGSLDSAVTLVQREYVPYVDILLRPKDAAVELAGMRDPPTIRVIAKTSALALCAGALRARAAMLEDGQ